MKKLLKSLIGMSLLCVGMFSVLHTNNNNSTKVAHAAEFDRVTDVINITTMQEVGVNLSNSNIKTVESGNFNNIYKLQTKKGSGGAEKLLCFVLEPSNDFWSKPYGFISSKKIGFVRSVTIQFANYSKLTDSFLPISLYGSNDDNGYSPEYDDPSPGILYTDDSKNLLYRFTLDKLDENYSSTIILENEDYKYIGLLVDYIDGLKNPASYIKEITVVWELHEFEDDIRCDLNTNGFSLKPNETYQIPTPTFSGDGTLTDGKVIYSTGDKSIATVDENGLITATGYGHTSIKVQYGSDFVISEIFVMNPIYLNSPSNPKMIENSENLKEGDVVLFVYKNGDDSKVLSAIEQNGDFGVEADCKVNDENCLSDYGNGELFYVSGNNQIGFTFASLTGEILAFNIHAPVGYYAITDGGEANKWNVDITDGVASINSTYDGQKALLYDGEFNSFDIMSEGEYLSIFKIDYSVSTSGILLSDIENRISPAFDFSEKFLEEMGKICDINGVNTNTQVLLNKWDQLFSDSTYEFKQIGFLSTFVFDCTEADPNGDTIQKALYLYEYIIGKYEELADRNYLNRTVPSNSIRIAPNLFNCEDDGTLLCVLSLSCLTLLTSVLYLYKKKKSL